MLTDASTVGLARLKRSRRHPLSQQVAADNRNYNVSKHKLSNKIKLIYNTLLANVSRALTTTNSGFI